jgi:murein DD-endopeptidase MepM/ murein hydrolase activator NlpD
MHESRPSVEEIRERLETEMTGRSRTVYTLLLLFDLAVGIVIASLLLTEEGLPARTQIAFTGMLVIAVVWAVFFLRALGRRKLFLAGHRLAAARLALVFTSLFTLSALVLATLYEDVRSSSLAASGFGVVMLVIATTLFIRARRRVSELIARRNQLEHQIAGRNASSGAALVLTLLATLLIGGDSASAQAISPNPFEAIVPAPPIPVRALGRDHLVYELHLTNFGQETHRLVALSAFDESEKALAAWNAEELAARAANIGNPMATPIDLLLLRAGERKVLHLWLSLPPGAKQPELLKHRLTTASEGDPMRHELEIPSVQLDGEAPLLKSAPVPPGRWVSIRGPSNTSGHRRSLVPLEGRVRVPQRFAVDWAKLGVDGKLYEGDGRENAEWYGYDLPVFAVLPGRVEKVIDGIEENAPFAPPDEAMVNRENAAGNAVIVRVGERQYAIYAHLRPGSIRVKPGDAVTAADELGRIGNSGHSLAPHLHFHFADRPDVLASEGLPFLMSSFQLVGRIDSPAALLKGEGWEPRADRPAREVSDEMPLENMVVDVD